jgi:RNA polymerase sigma-70 factor (ECF subfamily)
MPHETQTLRPSASAVESAKHGVKENNIPAVPAKRAMNHDPSLLLQQAKSGNQTALGELLKSYESYLTLLSRVQIGRKIQGKVDPGDIVQEVFLQVNRQFPQFRGTTEAEWIVWLRRILAGELALTLRRYIGTKGRDVNLEHDLVTALDHSAQSMNLDLADSISSPSQRASRREQAVILASALDELPEDYREVIVLRHLEGHSFAEVATRMGRSEDSVQKLWVRALGNLRRAMESVS